MPISIEMMKAAAAGGLSVVCASCEKYWNARVRGIPGDQCQASSGCRSPLLGGDFHEYRGFITEEAFGRFCFVCGADSVCRVRKTGSRRQVGICKEHVDWLVSELRKNPRPASQPASSAPLPKLMQAILDTEREWAEADHREFDPAEVFPGLDHGSSTN